jgi:hypothetical protein
MGEQWPRKVDLEWQSIRMPRSSMMMNDRRYAKTTHLMGRQLRGWNAMSDSMNSLALINPYGIHRSIPVEGFSGMRSFGRELTYSGSLMLLLTQSELIAIDLFRTLGVNREDPIRWRRTLGTDGQPVAKRRSAATPFGNQIYRNMMVSATADNGDAQLILGPVLGDRLFLLQGTELICLDTVTGEERWRTTTEAVGTAVVHADDRVMVVSQAQNQIESYDIHDGELLATQDRAIGSVISSLGAHLLTVTQVNKNVSVPSDASEEMQANLEAAKEMHDPQLVELIDMRTGETVHSRVADTQNVNETAAYAEMTDGRYFTLLDHTGRATIWDLLSGREIADVMVPARKGLYGVAVMQIQDQMLILPRHRKPNRDLAATRSVAVSGGAAVQPITAMHAISTVDGSLRWSRSFDDAWGCTVEQPWVTPMLLMARAHLTVPGNGVRRRQMDVMGISVVDGKTLHEIERKETNSNTNVIESRVKLIPHRNTMLAEIQLELLTYTFSADGTDDQVPPETEPQPDEADEVDDQTEVVPE